MPSAFFFVIAPMGMYKGLGRGLGGPSCESYVFSDATGAAPPVVTYYASTTF